METTVRDVNTPAVRQGIVGILTDALGDTDRVPEIAAAIFFLLDRASAGHTLAGDL